MPWLNAKRAVNGRYVKENFADWFGNSQVVDDAGAPLVVYHGTHADFDAFDPEKSFRGIGFQFAGEKETGEFYAHGHENGRVLACFLKMSNPYVVDLDERAEEVDGAKTEDELSGGDYYPNVPVDWFHKEGRNEIKHAIEHEGYDGYVLKGAGETLYGVISPFQIKSVDNCDLFLNDSPSLTDSNDVMMPNIKSVETAAAIAKAKKARAAVAKVSRKMPQATLT